MTEKIFKSIFRLDFPLAYKILDKLGEYLEIINSEATQEPFLGGQGNINTTQHALAYTAEINRHDSEKDNDVFTLNLNLKTFNAVIEFPDGCDIGRLDKSPLFSLADKLIEKLQTDHSPKYDRIGIRSFVLVERPEFSFEKIRNYMWESNNIYSQALNKFFPNKYDIGLVLESSNKKEENVLLQIGPYQKSERKKYFEFEHIVEEGLILDIDIYQPKISIPKLKLGELINSYKKIYQDLVKEIQFKIIEELK